MIVSLTRFLLGLAVIGLPNLLFAADGSAPGPVAMPSLPTLFIVGDSTAANGEPNAIGWGKEVGEYFDSDKIHVLNRAIGGRSSRTYVSEGHWDKLLGELKQGDTVIIQFGQNDGADMNGPRVARGSLPGLGEETQAIDNVITKQPEVVHTFGWYMRKMIADTRSRGASPILLTLTVRNFWKDGHVERGSGSYDQWIRELAAAEKVPLVDHTALIADRYEQIGQVATNAFFPRDHVHTSEDGARLNAFLAVSGLKGLREQSIFRTLSLAGRLVPTASPTSVRVPVQPPPKGGDRSAFTQWLNLPSPADPKLPTIWLIGDSTVRNGKGNGYDGQFGWGDPLERYFYPAKVNLVNRAVGGTGARTYRAQWERIRPELKAKDVVILQFGHNDNGARGALPGTGEESEDRAVGAAEQKESVRTFGWYLRRYIAETREAGADVIVCSLVPRNTWREGKLVRPENSHAAWARQVADHEQVPFIDLNTLIGNRYDELGQNATTALFADKTVHTNWVGAELNAKIVADALRALPASPVANFLRPGM